jgi:hypothetical protein
MKTCCLYVLINLSEISIFYGMAMNIQRVTGVHSRGVTLNSHPPLVLWSKRVRAITPLPLGACMAVAGQLFTLIVFSCITNLCLTTIDVCWKIQKVDWTSEDLPENRMN